MSDGTIMSACEIRGRLEQFGGWNSILIPEFTFEDLRVDALIVDLSTRWARAFEIKVTRSDFLRDDKWTQYSKFCSSLSIACPWGLIKSNEVENPFGLLWVKADGALHWEKRPKRFQSRRGLAWLYTYTSIIEKELPRLDHDRKTLFAEVQHLKNLGGKRA